MFLKSVRPNVTRRMLFYLKMNNPIYHDIEIGLSSISCGFVSKEGLASFCMNASN